MSDAEGEEVSYVPPVAGHYYNSDDFRADQRRATALQAAITSRREGTDTYDHVLIGARKYLAFLEGKEK
jgi:hypothetical protein